MISLILTGSGCRWGAPCENPQEVIEEFYIAVENADMLTAWGLLDRKSREALEKISSELKTKTGSKMPPWHLLVPGSTQKQGKIARIKLESEKRGTGKVSNVTLIFQDGTSKIIPLVREGNCFKIRLEL